MAIVLPIVSTFDSKGIKSALRQINDAEGGFRQFGVAAKLGFAAAGAAAAGFAISLAVDGVQAAIQEQAELTKLNTTLKNLGFGAASDSVNKWIDDLQYATGVTDSEMRPALDRLARSSSSVAEAQDMLKLALDASAGSGKSLQAVSEALGRAMDGNTTSLGKLGLGIDKATLASGDLNAITSRMKDLFAGQAAAAAGTFEGKMKTLAIAADELKEAFGTGFIEGFGEAVAAGEDLTDQLRELQDEASRAGKTAGKYAANATEAGAASLNAADSLANFAGSPSWDTLIAYLRDSTGMAGKFDTVVNSLTSSKFTAQAFRIISGYLGIKIAAEEATAAANSLGNGGYTPDPNRDYKPAYSYTPDPYGQYEDYTKTLLNLQKVINDKRRAEEAAAEAARNASRASGGSSRATKELTAAQKKLQAAYDATSTSVETWKDKLSEAAAAVETAKSGIAGLQEQLLSGSDLSDAWKTAADSVKAAAESEGKLSAITWMQAFEDQLKAIRERNTAIQELMKTLNPADTVGNKMLLERLLGGDPAEAAQQARDMVRLNLGPQYAAELSALFGETGTLATQLGEDYFGFGMSVAEQNYLGIKTTLEGKLEQLYKLGVAMGEKVAAGYNAVVKGLPADVKIPGKVKSGGDSYTITVQAGIGDPIAIGAQIERVLRTRALRLGTP